MELTIGITGINAVDSPGPGVAVARSIVAARGDSVNLIGLAYDAIDPGLFDRELFRAGYLLPYPREGRDALLRRLQTVQEKTPLDVLIPTLDSEMQNFAEIEGELEEMGVRMFIPSMEQIAARSKSNLAKLGEEHGFAVPQTVTVYDPGRLPTAADNLGYPLLVKGIYYEAYLCHDLAQVQSYAALVARKWGYPILLQEYLEGEEFNAAAIGDGQGHLVGLLGMKKILLTDKGKGWAGVSIRNPRLEELTRQFVETTRWKGALEMETLLARRDGQLYILEINPRFPAWIYLSVAAGNNLPDLYVDLALGNPVSPATEYQVGKLFTHYTIDLIGEISQLDSLLTKGEIHYL